MAQYGEYGGPIKRILGSQSITALNGSNKSTVITHADQTGNISSMQVVMIITTTGNCYVEITNVATTSSLALTSSDTLIAKIPSGASLGVYGNGGTPTITVKKVVC